MSSATIAVDAALKERLADLARRTGQPLEVFIGSVLRRIADTDAHVERGIPVFPRRPDAPVLTAADVDRLVDGE